MATIRDRMEKRNGWVWPKIDTQCFDFSFNEEPEIPAWVMGFVPGRRTVVQAGGNCGQYVAEYCNFFERVITFEPEAANHFALVANVDADNCYAFRAALGALPGGSALLDAGKNIGAHYIAANGPIPTLPLDAFRLEEVDLIHLDIEGYEAFALIGARDTIARCKPWIALEDRRGHSLRYQMPESSLGDLLRSYGYEQHATYKHEVIWKPT